MIDKAKLDAIVERTKSGGGELVNLMGTSAWYAPGAAAAQMAVSILKDEKRIYPCCVQLNGQYGLKNLFVGAPVKLGKKGIEKIITLKLRQAEKDLLKASAAAVQQVVDVLNGMGIV
jgi:malate dehydrogenase